MSKSIVCFLFPSLLIVSLILPSGNLGGYINIKLIIFSAVFFTFIFIKPVKVITFCALIFLMLAPWLFLGVMKGNAGYAFSQFKDVFITILFMFLMYCYIDIKKQNVRTLFFCVFYTVIFLALIKVSIFVISAVTKMPVGYYIDNISYFFGVKLMTLDVSESSIGRINFISDYIIPYIIFFMLKYGKQYVRSNILLYCSVGLLVISVFASFSRFIWGISILCIVFAIFSSGIKKNIYVFLITISFIPFFLISDVYDALALRFSSQQINSSDGARSEQYNNLIEQFFDEPILGHGLGYYIRGFVRSTDAMYSYELQFNALLMQVGIIGVALLLGVLGYMSIRHYQKLPSLMEKFIYFSLYFTWLCAGFFNPVLFSSAGGVIFSFFILYPVCIQTSRDFDYAS